jgi:regulator of sirC expression with transglutaminase-like and TPR domain
MSAIADETKALELDPRRPRSWITRAAAREQSNDAEGAIADYTRFLELAPDHEQAPLAREHLEKLRGPSRRP